MTLVEYVLFVSVFALVSVSAVGAMNSGARSYFANSGSRIGQPAHKIKYDQNGNRQEQASTTTITAPPSTTTTTRATTTTAAPTTTRATTTTAAPTTTRATTTTRPTTTTTSTTTTTIPRRVSTAIANSSFNTSGGTWTFRVNITVTGTGGASVNNLNISAVGKLYGNVVGNLSCTTNSSGQCSMTYSGVPDDYSPIVFEITSVSGSAAWTGSTRTLTVYDP